MPETLNEQMVDEVTSIKLNTMATIPASIANLSLQDALNQQRRVNEIATATMQNGFLLAQNMGAAVMGRTIDMMFGAAERAAAFGQTIKPMEQKLADIQAVLAGGQQQVKTAQTTPPQTGTGGAFGSDSGSALNQQIVNMLTIIAARLDNLESKK